MREIKLRVWDKKQKKIRTMGFNLSCDGDIIFADSIGSKNFEIMQFTGLLDKNGKEIYEGDIIKKVYFPFGAIEESIYFKIGKIVSSELDFFGIKWIINECQYINLPEKLKDNKFYKPYRENWEHPTNKDWLENLHYHYKLEIIGNIYEDKDLIN